MEVTPVPGADCEGPLLYVSGGGCAENTRVLTSILEFLQRTRGGGARGQQRHLGALLIARTARLPCSVYLTLVSVDEWGPKLQIARKAWASRSLESCRPCWGCKRPGAPRAVRVVAEAGPGAAGLSLPVLGSFPSDEMFLQASRKEKTKHETKQLIWA